MSVTPPFQLPQQAEHHGSLPKSVDVAVVGGGIIGVMTAWELTRAGLSVALFEKGRIAGEQSSRNWGWIRAQGRDPAEIPIMMLARQMWQDLAAQIPEDIGLRQCGVTYLANSQEALSNYESWTPYAAQHGLDAQILTADQTADLLPGADKRWAGALHTPSDMKAEPWVAVPAFARAAARDGVQIFENCAVRGLDLSAGRISGLVTEQGHVAAGQVVLAGGAWSALFLRRHGLSIPQLSVRATVAATAPLPDIYDGAVADDHIAFRRRADGGYTLAPETFRELYVGPDAFRALRAYARPLMADPFGTRLLPRAPSGFPDGWGTARKWADDEQTPFEHMRILNPDPNRSKVRDLASDFSELFPKLGPIKITRAWGGMIDTLPDVVPIVDRAPIDGLTVATGMCGHGFGIGPAFGRIAAQIVMGQDTGFDLTRFRFGRFSDGSKLDMGPTV